MYICKRSVTYVQQSTSEMSTRIQISRLTLRTITKGINELKAIHQAIPSSVRIKQRLSTFCIDSTHLLKARYRTAIGQQRRVAKYLYAISLVISYQDG